MTDVSIVSHLFQQGPLRWHDNGGYAPSRVPNAG